MNVVLNLIINGLPSILNSNDNDFIKVLSGGFKPYYKWITFNTEKVIFTKIKIWI